MSERVWTSEQLRAIEARNRNVIVSASAGSGKTAVLVERIFRIITDETRPVDVDRLLVVTFTKAAAAEMKERLAQRIEAEINALPLDAPAPVRDNLIRQNALIHASQISTIDSFCKKVVSEHFNEIGIDPSFRIADESELVLLKEKVLEELLEEYYASGNKMFLALSERLSPGFSDKSLEDIVLRLFDFAQSSPRPKQWLCGKKLSSGFAMDDIFAGIKEYSGHILQDVKRMLESAYDLSTDADGPNHYADTISSEIEYMDKLMEKDSDALCSIDLKAGFGRLPGKGATEAMDEEKKKLVCKLRDDAKKALDGLKKDFYYNDPKSLADEVMLIQDDVDTIIDLTIDFTERYRLEKARKNVVDFSDIEHMAYAVLADEEGRPTGAAREYRDNYEEILIDEYQDSNDLQECILNSISREALGTPNMFMVGDVKQSIYSFRQAKPALFINKYETYQLADGSEADNELLYERIDLTKNFRSRLNILDGTNAVFEQIMKKTLGGVEYDDAARLRSGTADNTDYSVNEVLLMDMSGDEGESEQQAAEDGAAEDELADIDAKEAECYMIADRIRELTDGGRQYKDIVILLRSMKGWSETMVSILTERGIPAVCETGTGYFSAWEVEVVLNLLRVLDNPLQDIPLCSVMMSYLGGFTPEEMALIRANARESCLWDALLQSEEDEKCAAFVSRIEEYRKKSTYMPVHELISELVRSTGFYTYISAMPAGSVRKANIDMLAAKAVDFEASSYQGLFQFVRYIEKLQRYEIDYGEALSVSDENVVRIMTIHKSKGLEFPVVFVAGMSKNYNLMDTRNTVLLHQSLGVAMDYVDLEQRTKSSNIFKRYMARRLQEDAIGEELRVLYVAMTRAKEQLILTAYVKKLDKSEQKWHNSEIGFKSLFGSECYLNPVMSAIRQCKAAGGQFEVRVVKMGGIYRKEMGREYEKRFSALLKSHTAVENADESLLARIAGEMEYSYPYLSATKLKGKLTVSEIKRLHLEEESAGEVLIPKITNEDMEKGSERPPYNECEALDEFEPYVPKFAREEAQMAGNVRGTLYHFVLEKLPFARLAHRNVSFDEIAGFLSELVSSGAITEEEKKAINLKKLALFLSSDIAGRIRTAENKGRLHRESPFVIGLRDNELIQNDSGACDADQDMILVQGIIDLWFEEDDGIVLLDYKTDRVDAEDGEAVLRERYKIQLDYYEKALLQTADKNVKERMIYSFGLSKAISV